MNNSVPSDIGEPASSKGKRRVVFLAKLLISASLLVYLFSLVELESLRKSILNFKPEFIAAAVFLLLFQSVLSTFKWRMLLAADGVYLRFRFLLKTYLISNFVSLFLPTSFGGDVYRVMAIRKAGKSTAKTASSVIFDRLSGLFALLSIAAFSYVAFSNFPYKEFVVAAYAVGLLVFWVGTSGWIMRRFGHVQNKFFRKILKIFESFYTYSQDRRCLAIVLLISLAFQLNVVVINKMYSLTLGLSIPLETLMAIIPLVYLTEAIPLSINGIGFREGAFVFFYQAVGQTAEAGLAVSLIVLTMRYCMGLIGGVLLVITTLQNRTERAIPAP